MLTSNEHSIQKQAQVDFTRSGWRQFFKLNRSLGTRFIRGFVLRYELAAYLTAHEAAGVELDEGCQEVCYENGVYLLLRKMQGVWYITDIFAAEETIAYEPIFFRKENVPAARAACQKSIVSLCRTPHDLIRQKRLYADRRSRQFVFTKGQ